MAYIDKHYYTFTYFGRVVPVKDFDRLAQRSSDVIDWLTFGRASRAESAVQKSAVKKATAAQMEYLFSQGDYDAYTGNPDNSVHSENIGNYRYSKNSTQGSKSLGGIPVSPLAISYLEASGLRSCLI